ncbi:halocyanin domain-containing protein [Halomicrobium zhouii]|uniref:Halocyanin domain-containing protein n=1 Tax=Halomicrobium zhouii TaxID=767519 RepID=A0A1I6K1K4_9EURY|nr:halocyanin domain-containing protein [Halomicrobium zhouii]SFR85113.1 halocyanin domain-containing protein [Halomicrobium zhouii]
MNTQTYSRRSVLRAGAGAAIGGAALASARPTRAQTTFDGYLDNVDNYDGVVDETGSGEVTVEVGSQANGGTFGFGPAAVQVDPGTTVTWEWVAGSHNVEAEDGSFESELTDEAGFTFEQTFEEEGVVKYFCMPHKSMGMKGVVVVGDLPGGSGGSSGGGSSDSGSGSAPGFDGYLDNADNYDGLVDETGSGNVTVEVGSQANGGNFGFGPAAIRVDPGTTVTWEWVAGSHNVEAEDGSFESELTDEQGFTFDQTFEEEGVVKYFCMPHKSMGMKGVVVVGDPALGGAGGGGGESGGSDAGGSGGGSGELSGADWGAIAFGVSLVAGLLSPLAFAAFLDRDDQPMAGERVRR